jgi:ATP-binding cassette subfamily G (WHITE) protein 2
MGVVKKLTEETGITVVSTIHSPTPYAFNLFDDIMILLRGRVAYFGPNGPAAKEFFERTNPDAPAFGSKGTSDNLAEWIVDLTTSVRPRP